MNIALQLLPVAPVLLVGSLVCLAALFQLRRHRTLAALVAAATCLWMVVVVRQHGFWILVNERNLKDPSNAGPEAVFALSTGFSLAVVFPWLVLGGAAVTGRVRPQ